MNYDFNKRINRVGTDSVKWDSKEEYKSGEVILMWIGDMDFECPKPIVDAIVERSKHHIFGYAHRSEEFQDITVNWLKRRHNWNIKCDWVTFSPGVVPAISAFVQCFTNIGDKVLIQRPVYYPFTDTIEDCGREVVSNSLISRNNHYEIDFEDLEKKAKRDDIKAMIICNPHNPVGRVYTEEELRRIEKICIENDLIVFCDEIHSDFVMQGYKHIPLASLSSEISNRTVTAIAPSKTFNVAGLQAASVITSNQEFMKKIEKHFKMNTQHLISDFGLVAYKAAYTKCDDYVNHLVDYIEENAKIFREYIKESVPQIKVVDSEGTYLLWLDCRKLEMTNEELDRLFNEKIKISLDSGYWFGPEGNEYMRINIACPREILIEALKRIELGINNIKLK